MARSEGLSTRLREMTGRSSFVSADYKLTKSDPIPSIILKTVENRPNWLTRATFFGEFPNLRESTPAVARANSSESIDFPANQGYFLEPTLARPPGFGVFPCLLIHPIKSRFCWLAGTRERLRRARLWSRWSMKSCGGSPGSAFPNTRATTLCRALPLSTRLICGWLVAIRYTGKIEFTFLPLPRG